MKIIKIVLINKWVIGLFITLSVMGFVGKCGFDNKILNTIIFYIAIPSYFYIMFKTRKKGGGDNASKDYNNHSNYSTYRGKHTEEKTQMYEIDNILDRANKIERTTTTTTTETIYLG